jgi:outer membrane immunogenic protein
MKQLLLAGAALGVLAMAVPALAADMSPRPAPAPLYKAPPPMQFTWTGCYLGGHVGGGWGQKTVSDPTGGAVGSASFDINGWMAGGQAGCNYQVSNFVLGIEGDASWADIKGSSSDPFFGGKTFDAKADFLADVAGRVGIAWDHGLIYGKGGVAFVHDKYDFVGGLLGANATGSENRAGWTVGGGVEWAFTSAWSAKAEYLHYDFGGKDVTLSDPVLDPVFGPSRFHINQKIDTVKFGLNFRFLGG